MTIEGYGEVTPLSWASFQPNPELRYRLIFAVSRAAEGEGPNPGLWHVARTVNLLDAARIGPGSRELAAVAYGPAARVALTDEAYREHFGRANPDSELALRLARAGVKLYVCGQSLHDQGLDHSGVASDFRVALAALIVLATLQLEGYVLMPV